LSDWSHLATGSSPLSYWKPPDHGYEHDYAVYEKEFVSSKDTSVHTQNIEARNQ